jgi:hypothetical protein
VLEQRLFQLTLAPAFGAAEEVEQVRIAGRLLREI